MSSLRHGLFLVAEKVLTFCVHPRLRARLLSLLGACVGRNVRVYEARFMNLAAGFSNLHLADDVHVGPGCLLDLADRIEIGAGAVLAPRVTVLTHLDVGSQHGAPLLAEYPVRREPVRVGAGSFVGAGAILLAGTELGGRTFVAAGAVVSGKHAGDRLLAGAPAKVRRTFSS